jgi:MFS family permease
MTARLEVLRKRDFRVFYAGYLTSLLGSSMSILAITFAVLRAGGHASGLGIVLAARTAPEIAVVLAGGVAADRFGRRKVMIIADVTRCGAQAAFAAALLRGASSVWLFAAFAAVGGAAQGVFRPALGGLTADITPRDDLANANALLGLAGSAARIAGPALAGLLITVTSPAVVLAVDAASYAVSVVTLVMLRTEAAPRGRGGSLRRDLADGWAQFRAHRWLLPSTLQFTFINALAWGPFLLLGPVVASRSGGGAASWGAIMACYGAGSVTGGLCALGRRPGRPLAVSVAATFGYGLPCAALAAGAPLAVTAAAAVLAGVGSAISAALAMTVVQQQVPRERLARVRSIQSLAAFSASPVGLVLAGPAAAATTIGTVLACSAVFSAASAIVTLAIPGIRQVRWAAEGVWETPRHDGNRLESRSSPLSADGPRGSAVEA